MKKSAKGSLWFRLIPAVFLILIAVAFYINISIINPQKSAEARAYALMVLIMYITVPVILLSIATYLSPWIGGIISLVLIPVLIYLFRGNENPFNWLSLIICGGLFLSGVSGIFLGIWNSRGKKVQDNKSQNNLIR
jgi:hypothetical protein